MTNFIKYEWILGRMQSMRLQLLMLGESSSQPSGPNKIYEDSHVFSTEIFGQELEYVFVHNTTLDDYAQGSRLGFEEEGNLFVSRHLHPTQVPFVALFLHCTSLGKEDLEKRFGADVIKGLSNEQITDTMLRLTLDVAGKYLRPKETADLAERIENEPWFNRDRHYVGIEKLRQGQVADNVPTILSQANDSLKLYTERISDYLTSHHRNKHVRKSRELTSLLQGIPDLKSLFGTSVVRADPVYLAIQSDPTLQRNIAGLLPAVEAMTELRKSEQIIVDPVISRLLYLCVEKSTARNPPIEFVEGIEGLEQGYNVIRVGKHCKKFFEGLARRLQHTVFEERRKVLGAIEGIEHIVTSVGETSTSTEFIENASRAIALLREQGIEDQTSSPKKTAIVPYGSAQAVRETLIDTERELALAATLAPNNVIRIDQAARARGLLNNLGLPTTEIDELITREVAVVTGNSMGQRRLLG